MAERERALTPPRGGVVAGTGTTPGPAAFVPRATVLDAEGVRRAITRIAHEILERNAGVTDLAIVGLQTGGAPLARRLADELERIEGQRPPVGTLDVAFYRDDIGLRPVLPEAVTDIPFDLTGNTVVLVDDVLYTGRTVRAALNALGDYGRATAVQLAVMVDRGHRELPIRPDYVGKNLPTKKTEIVDVTDDSVVIGELR